MYENVTLDDFEVSFAGPPYGPGCYAVCACVCRGRKQHAEHVLYIGSSKHIRQRVLGPSHPYRIAINRIFCGSVYTRNYETENYRELERAMLRRYRPYLNRILYR